MSGIDLNQLLATVSPTELAALVAAEIVAAFGGIETPGDVGLPPQASRSGAGISGP